MSTPTDPYSRHDHEDGHDDILDPLPEEQADELNAQEAENLGDQRPSDEPHVEPTGDADQSSESFDQAPASFDQPTQSHPVAFDREDRPDSTAVPERDHRGDAQLSDEPEFADSETESTRSWTPNFSDDDDSTPARAERESKAQNSDSESAPAETERERWEREFGNTGASTGASSTRSDDTVVRSPGESVDATVATPVVPAPASDRTGNYPTRTSVFNRVSSESAGSSPTSASSPTTVSTPASAPYARPAGTDFQYEEPIPEEPKGRGWSHVGVFFGTLLLAPLAWYLVADAGVRFTEIDGASWTTGSTDWLVVLELLGALLCFGVLWFLASYSSVGPIVFGVILLAAGAFAVFAPAFTQDLLASNAMQSFAGFNDFTGNVGYHLTNSLATGRLAVYGFLLLMTGVVSHQARRHGAERGEVLGRRGVLLSRKSDS
ncbi:MAG: hypothetical protein QMB98_01470 [Flaviflexus sp.]|uniref:hypothetical protein n=1 Tax=Flaviflexus sp. TaxID=1969482 RepID=UPI00352F0931